SIEKHFQEICKEQSIDLTAQAPALPDVSAPSESRSQKTAPAMDAPLPDATITPQMMEHFGYTDSDMLPLSKDRAMELMDKVIT
ncbi:hypothetical protein RFX30_19125, partial [Acinetobacter baumannii]|nr:hypothetical protein [Acinetobacter baumannii]